MTEKSDKPRLLAHSLPFAVQRTNVMEPQLKPFVDEFQLFLYLIPHFNFFDIIFLVADFCFFISSLFIRHNAVSLANEFLLLYFVIFMTFMTICQISLRKTVSLCFASHRKCEHRTNIIVRSR